MARAPAGTGWRIVFLALLTAVCWLAFGPAPPKSVDTGWDKLNHLLAFSALAFSARCALAADGRKSQGAQAGLVALGLFAYGGLIELVQSQLPHRSAEALDVLADCAGIAAGLVSARLWQRVTGR